MLVAILHFVPDRDEPGELVSTLIDALPPGSYLVASHATPEYDPDRAASAARVYHQQGIPFQFRTADEFSEIAFGGLDMVEPGIVPVCDWRPGTSGPRPLPAEVGWNGGMARKP